MSHLRSDYLCPSGTETGMNKAEPSASFGIRQVTHAVHAHFTDNARFCGSRFEAAQEKVIRFRAKFFTNFRLPD